MKLITRYSNRKMYDPDTQEQVNFPQLRGWIRAGIPVQILCHNTKRDITAEILVRVISDEVKKNTVGASVEILTQVIAAGGIQGLIPQANQASA